MRKSLFYIFLLFGFSNCEKIVLGNDEPNNPENNFELLWKDFDLHYSLFHIKGTNWDSLYKIYRPQVTANSTTYELWDIICSMLEQLNDSHTAIYMADFRNAYVSGFALGRKAIDEEFSLPLVKSVFVESLTRVAGEDDMHYGKIRNKDIGYIFLREEAGDDPAKAITGVIGKLKDHKAIIFDLRTNDGGDARYAKVIAGGFSDGVHLVATVQTRNGPNHNDFNAKVNEMTQKTGADQFLKPVIMLTDRATISGGEYLAMHMRTFKHVTQIGDTTAGDFSVIGTRSFLPNGWAYQYSVQMFLLPDGTSLDGIGIAPNIYIRNTKADIDAGKDKVLDKAIEYLFTEYGIQ
jgi:carboxyl-terminal processing protease